MKAEKLFDSQLQIDLAKAAAKGDTNQLSILIARGADVNGQGRRGMKPLFWALINGNFNGFEFLLEHGADPNAAVTIVQPPPETALTLAASVEDSRYLEGLLKHGANPNLPAGNPSQETAIFIASLYHHTNNIALLLKYGADIDWKITGSMTPLHDAISAGSFQMALFLYRCGANPLVKDKWGYSPVDTLKQFGENSYKLASRSDKSAYKQLLYEIRKAGLWDMPDVK